MNEPTIIETVPDYLSEINSCETLEEFATVGLALSRQKTHSQWCLGLLALKVESKYGDQSLANFAKSINVSSSSLQVYRWTVQKFMETNPQFIPPERLSFSALQSVAKLPVDQRASFLERAEDESMSVERVRHEVKQSTGGTVSPKFRVVHCEAHNKFHFIPVDPSQWEPAHEI